MNIEQLGQVFTPKDIVEKMILLRKNKGSVLEPSAGDGAFYNEIPNCVGIELDETKCPEGALNIDFFDYDKSNKFDTIIGNPPYVKYNNILDSTKDKLNKDIFDGRSNLYLFFIHKCIEHLKENGELIFIVPREFLKATSSIKLNEFIFNNGTITDIIDLGDSKVFNGACPNTIIFRFEKDNFSRKTTDGRNFKLVNGQLMFLKNDYNVKFSDLFFVKVGAVSGADKYFESENGNLNFVCSTTRTTKKTKKMFYNIEAEEIKPFKKELLDRKLKSFSEKDWFMWGRKYYESKDFRIYVNNKTRTLNPFFYHSCKAYDGSVLAIFPKFKTSKKEILEIIDELNKVDWEELGFVCDGRFIFSQKALENCILTDNFKKYIKANKNKNS